MKKKNIVLAVSIISMLLSACGGYRNENINKTKLVVGDWPTEEGIMRDKMFQTKNYFETKYPNVDIVPDSWFFDLKSCYLKVEAGMLPNVFLAPFTEVSDIIEGGYAKDVTDELKKRKIYENMNESVRELISKNERVYAVPNTIYAFGVKYNTKMFEAAGLTEADGTPKQPQTWEELAEFAVKIKEATGKPGFSICTADKCGGWMLTNIAWSYGVEFMKRDENGRWIATFDTDEMVQTLEFIKKLRWKYDVLPESILIDRKDILRNFSMGNVGMVISAPEESEVAGYGLKPEEYGILSIPAGPVRWVTLVGGNVRFISNKTDEEQLVAALDWIKFDNRYGFEKSEYEEYVKKNIENKRDSNIAIGIKGLSIWNKDCESLKYTHKLIDENTNMKHNASKFYNESLTEGKIELQFEEKICAQDLYAILDNCIQKILADENADCRELARKANYDFQTNILDNITY